MDNTTAVTNKQHRNEKDFAALRLARQYIADGYAPVPAANDALTLETKEGSKAVAPRMPLMPYKALSDDPEEMLSQFRRAAAWVRKSGYPASVIGVAISMAHSGTVLLDLDTKYYTSGPNDETGHRKAADKLLTVLLRKAGVPETDIPAIVVWLMLLPHARSRSGGYHIFFRAPAGAKLRSHDAIVTHVDIKAGWPNEHGVAVSGGIAFAPGTVTGNGKYQAYGVEDGGFEARATYVPVEELPEAPEWLCKLLTREKQKNERGEVASRDTAKTSGTTNTLGAISEFEHLVTELVPPDSPQCRYLRAAVRGILEDFAGAPSGEGNSALNGAAYALGTLAHRIHEDCVEEALVEVDLARSQRIGGEARPIDEFQATFTSGFDAGKASPRDLSATEAKLSGVEKSSDPKYGLPEGYEVRGDWLSWCDKDGEAHPICSPLKIFANTRDPNGTGWALLVEARQIDGKWQRVVVPKILLAETSGKAVAELLLNNGATIGWHKAAPGMLRGMMLQAQPTDTKCRATKIGWHGPAFVLRDQVIGGMEAEHVYFDGAPLERSATSGALADWQAKVAKPLRGQHLYIFGLGVPFAATLLKPLAEEGGLFHFHGHSTAGKTTLLRCIQSVIGSPEDMCSWRQTDNAMESRCEAHNDLAMQVDEMKQGDPRAVAAGAYMIANGKGKARAKQDGSEREVKAWNLLGTSTGELTLASMVAQDRYATLSAGQTVRIIDVPAVQSEPTGVFTLIPATATGKKFAEFLTAQTGQYYGTAIRAYLRWLVPNLDEALKLARVAQAEFEGKLSGASVDPQVGRVLKKFALVYAGLTLAINAGVLPLTKDECSAAVGHVFASWVRQRGHVGSYEASQAVSRITDFISRHASRFEDLEGSLPSPHNRAGFRRTNFAPKLDANGNPVLDPKTGKPLPDFTRRVGISYLFFPTVFEEACGDIDRKLVTSALTAAKLLVPEGNGPRATRKERLPGYSNPQRVYRVDVT